MQSCFLSHLAKGHVSYCHHLASVIVVVYSNAKLISSDTTLPIETKLGMNVPWDVLHRTDVGIFDFWLPLLQIEHRGQTVLFCISPKPLGFAKFFQ